MVRLKVCCISSPKEAEIATRLGAHCLGLVGEMPSGPGTLKDDQIIEIAKGIPPGVSRFLLTSKTRPQDIVAHVKKCGCDVVQIVDELDEVESLESGYEYLRREMPGIRIVQVLHVEDEEILQHAKKIAPLVDCILLDSGTPKAAVKVLGGTGKVHDWNLSAKIVELVSPCPVFLAGGITPENVKEAIELVKPFGIDLCSGVRTSGNLDEDKLKRLVEAMYS